MASAFLCSKGFGPVYNVAGGMGAWKGETVLCIDSDGDGVLDDIDICPSVADPSQDDSNGDGVGDACEDLFLRGDSNGDRAVDISDAVFVLLALFTEAGALDCEDAADANDDGAVDVTDPIKVLRFLFGGEDPPPEPFGDCGTDSSDDELECSFAEACR